MRSQQLIEVLKTVVVADLGKPRDGSVIRYFMSHLTHGGWEHWLQTEFAVAVFAAIGAGNHTFDRERAFPNRQACDLLLEPERGVPIWVELKAQRYSGYANTFDEFKLDVGKLFGQASDFRRDNVLLAAAVFAMTDALRQPLRELAAGIRAGTLTYQILYDNKWQGVNGMIDQIPRNALVLASFVPA